MLDLNITMLIQMVNFFIALYGLNVLLIRPVRAILQERRQKVDGLVGEAEAFDREAAQRIAAYQAELVAARQEATAMRESGRNEGIAKQQEIVGEAGKKAQEELVVARDAVRAEAEDALTVLRKQVDTLAGKVVAKVAG